MICLKNIKVLYKRNIRLILYMNFVSNFIFLFLVDRTIIIFYYIHFLGWLFSSLTHTWQVPFTGLNFFTLFIVDIFFVRFFLVRLETRLKSFCENMVHNNTHNYTNNNIHNDTQTGTHAQSIFILFKFYFYYKLKNMIF